MKRKLLYSFFIAAAMSFSGCSSFLEENPVDQMPESEAYKNPEMIYLNTVANLYTKIGADAGGSGLAGTDRGLYDLNTFCADDAILPTRGGDWDMGRGGRSDQRQDAQGIPDTDQKTGGKTDQSCICSDGSETGCRSGTRHGLLFRDNVSRICVPDAYVAGLFTYPGL